MTGESSHCYKNRNRSWFLGSNNIEEDVEYKHLGILFDKFKNINTVINEACSKLRSTFLSIINCGIYSGGIHPSSSKIIYKTIVLPKALYGCELWGHICKSNMLKLERAHRFCIKYIQSVSKYTKTYIALSMLGCLPIEAEINKRKLIFLGQLCRLNPKFHAKRVFVNRLFDFKNNPNKVKGFVSDIDIICKKYEIGTYLDNFMESCHFPSKLLWKKIINKSIYKFENRITVERCLIDKTLHGFNILHNNYDMCEIWKISQKENKLLKQTSTSIHLICKLFNNDFEQTCPKCGLTNLNNAEHVLLNCIYNNDNRYMLWRKLFMKFGIEFYRLLISMPPRIQLIHLFSGMRFYLSSEDSDECLKLCINEFHKMWTI